jgi:hypothetical protein
LSKRFIFRSRVYAFGQPHAVASPSLRATNFLFLGQSLEDLSKILQAEKNDKSIALRYSAWRHTLYHAAGQGKRAKEDEDLSPSGVPEDQVAACSKDQSTFFWARVLTPVIKKKRERPVASGSGANGQRSGIKAS